MKPIPFKFSLRPGDLINALAGVKEVCRKQRTTADIYLGLDIAWKATPDMMVGRTSPYTLTEETMQQLLPLLMHQEYINGVYSLEHDMPDIYHGWCDIMENFSQEKVQQWYQQNNHIIDLDKQHLLPIGLPAGNLFRSNFYVYPDMACDLSERWLDAQWNGESAGSIVINRTQRCHNLNISYVFLEDYSRTHDLVFVGSVAEAIEFKREIRSFRWIQCADHLQLASIIRGCKLFIGNQSMCYSLAEALKVPRILEVNPESPNVIPCGEKAYDCHYQHAFEYYVEELTR